MIKKLKMLSLAAIVAVAAGTTTRAATPTNVTVLEKLTLSLTTYWEEPYVTNSKQTEITAKVKEGGFNTKTLLAAINAAGGLSFDTNKSSLAQSNNYVLTNGYVVVFTNSAQTNVYTNIYTGTNFAGLTNVNTEGLTIATNLIYYQTGSGWVVVDGAVITPLTNTLPLGIYVSGAGGTVGSTKAIKGVRIPSSLNGSGKYAYGYVELNTSSNTWSIYVNGYGGSSETTVQNLGTTKAPAYVDTSNQTAPVAGSGTLVTATSTNNYSLKGDVSCMFWKMIKN